MSEASLVSYLQRWELVADGDAITTHSSRLLPVRRDGQAAMLKLPSTPDERAGAALMPWWEGNGAARVLEHDEQGALLLERAEDPEELTRVARLDDDAATRVLCSVAAVLHAPRRRPPPSTLVPLSRWFEPLFPAARRLGGVLKDAAAAAEKLLSTPRDVVVLHGDLHHGNVMRFGERGWLAIDPKGLLGERGFDFANIFCNPLEAFAAAPERLAHRSWVVAEAAGLERERLLHWVLAYTGLSAAWYLEEDGEELAVLRVGEAALREIRDLDSDG